ncbi:hypothetical protein BDR04DRAFT_1114907 [Suillus decipiens]|nr:hypothetical protein BDR04DRAFT_1114907 [Suillus decipiens]
MSSTKEIGTPPPVFNGDTCSAVGWALQMNTYLEMNDGVYNSDKRKVIFFLSRMMKGEAAKWAKGHLKAAISTREFREFDKLISMFKGTFFPKNLEQTAIRRISTLK